MYKKKRKKKENELHKRGKEWGRSAVGCVYSWESVCVNKSLFFSPARSVA